MGRRRALIWLILAGVAAAQEPRTAARVADEVQAASQKKDTRTLNALAAADEPDPWLVADELLFRGEGEAAAAFARGAPRPAVEKLPAYVASRRVPDHDGRRALGRATAALAASNWNAALDACRGLDARPASVTRVRLAHVRAMALAGLRRRKESARAFALAADGARSLGWPARVSFVLDDDAKDAYTHSDFQGARAAWQARLAVVERLGDRWAAADTLHRIGVTHRRQREYLKALAAYERALAISKAIDDKAGVALRLNSIGTVHRGLRQNQRALAAYRGALEILEALNDRAGAAQALNNIGVTHRWLREYPQALEAYRRSLAIKRELDDKRGMGMTLFNIGNVYKNLGEYARALEAYGRALEIKQAFDDKAGVAAVLMMTGFVHRLLGEFEEALAVYRRSLEISESLDDKLNAAKVLASIGNVYESRKEYDASLVAYQRALEALEALEDKKSIAVILNNIANVYHARRESKKALEYYRRCLESMSPRDAAAVAGVFNNMGVVQLDLGEHEAALACHERALEVLGVAPEPYPQARALFGLAETHYRREDWAASVRRAREAVAVVQRLLVSLAEQQGATARNRWEYLFDIGALAALRKDEPAGDLAFFLESGRAGSLLESLSSRKELHAALIPPDLRTKEAEAHRAENQAVASLRRAARRGNRKEILRARNALDEARAALEAIIGRIQRTAKSGASIAYPKADELEAIQARLGAGDALVLYGLTGEGAMALVVRREKARAVNLRYTSKILAACDRLLGHAPPYVDPDGIAGLRERVIDPLALGDDVRRVLVSPMGRLGYVPFGVLLPEREVVYVPSGTTHGLLFQERDLRGEFVLALGDPEYTGGASGSPHRGAAITRLSRLPGTREEAAAIADRTLLGKDATEAGLARALAGHGRWRAVHFACHGLFDPDRPMLSSLALTPDKQHDGFLTCLEVFQLEIPADLVVLSACETGKGKIYRAEGIIGLTRAFMFAGAPRVIVSLWKVDDKATRALMRKFYELWNPRDGSKGLPTATALKQAQAFVASHEKWKHPSYWAAWQLWGLPE